MIRVNFEAEAVLTEEDLEAASGDTLQAVQNLVGSTGTIVVEVIAEEST